MTPARQARGGAGGFALMAVMWVVIIAGLILLGVRMNSWATASMARNELASVQAHWLARAGIEQALAVLEDDLPGVDSAADAWFDDEELFKDVQLVGGKFTVAAPLSDQGRPDARRFGLIDHSGRVNVNVADAAQLALLPRLDASRVEAILDWIDSDDTARSGGAEAGYYQQLRPPYQIRNGPMQTVRELLLVKGIDQEVFYGERGGPAAEAPPAPKPPSAGGEAPGLGELTTVYSYELNKDASGAERLNLNSIDKQTLVQRLNFSDALADAVVRQRQGKKFQSLMELLNVRAESSAQPQQPQQGTLTEISPKWLADHFDELTVSDEPRLAGRINVNTAGGDALMSLPGMTRDAAEAIIARRTSAAGPFQSAGDLLGSVGENQFKAFAERCTVRSNVFEIRSRGITTWGIQREIVAVVDRGAKPMAILYWYQSE